MKNLKRGLCLAMAMLLLSTQALAVVVPGGGTNVVPGGGGTTTGYGYDKGSTVGVAVGLQQMGGGKYDISPPETAGTAEDEMGPGLAEVVRHFTFAYPQPFVSQTTGQGTVYVLPKAYDGAGKQKVLALQGTNLGYADMQCQVKASAGQSLSTNTLADTIYNTATGNRSKNNPSPNLPANWFSTKNRISSISYDTAASVVAYIWGDANGSVSDSQMNSRFMQLFNYKMNVSPDKTLITVRYLSNYASILMYVARCLPQENWPMYEQYLNDFLPTALRGESYTPTVITVEICKAFEHNGDSNYTVWRTVAETIAAQTGVGENLIRSEDLMSARSEIATPGSTLNPAVSILKAAQAATQSWTANTGGLCMLGYSVRGGTASDVSATYGAYARGLSSVSKDSIGQASTVLSGADIGQEGIWGFGVFGLDSRLSAPPVITPVYGADVYPAGVIGIDVQKPSYTKPAGHYNQEVDVTLSINLNATGYEESGTEGTTTTNKFNSLASTLRWMQSVGAPPPELKIWLKQAEPVKAQGDSYHNGLTSVKAPVDSDVDNVEGGLLTWKDITNVLTDASRQLEGVTVVPSGGSNQPITIKFTNYAAAIKMFATDDAIITLKCKANIAGDIADSNTILEHYFKVGAGVTVYGPQGLDNLRSFVQIKAGLSTAPKYDWAAVVSTPPEEKPYFYSQLEPNYSEIKQGTVPTSGGGSSEKFNSMTGTPTFTDTSGRTDFAGTVYENAGKYYQYFAVGGNEFVVEFEGEYRQNQTATRNFTVNFSTATCNKSTLPCNNHKHGCMSEVVGSSGEPPSPVMGCTNPCSPQIHMSAHPHTVTTNTVHWNVQYTGLCFIQITNAKIWQLSEARLDGTRELLDTNLVTADVQSVAPSAFYNIASSNTAKAGRMVYDYLPNGAGAGGDPDNLTWTFSTPASCSGSFEQPNLNKVQDIIKNTAAATMVSDFIVLRTSNGDQSILYYEYRAGEGTVLASSATTSTTSPAIGNTPATITLSGGAQSTGIKFENRSYQQLWAGNSQTSKGASIQPTELTYGGYNGKYQDVTSKYRSSGHSQNISLESTAAYQNKSGAFKPQPKPNPVFRLLTDTLIIPDSKCNGEYVLGEAQVFYENILNFGSKPAIHQIAKCSQFGNQMGFTVYAPYSPSHDKINDIVVYNPVSVEDVLLVSLPEERDQRTAQFNDHEVIKGQVAGGCPGDSSCAFLTLDCAVTQHVHSEVCFATTSYPIHSGNNQHTHTAECPYHYGGPNTAGWSHIHCIGGCRDFMGTCTGNRATCSLCQSNVPFSNNTYPNDQQNQGAYFMWYHTSGCSYSGQTHTSTSNVSCSQCGHSCGYITGTGGDKVYDCGNKPLNTHVCDSGCYTVYTNYLSCSDTHHANNYNWKLYTTGLRHISGTVCTGRACSDLSNILFPSQTQYTLAQLQAGYVVYHTDGGVHLSTRTDVCTFCGYAVNRVLSSAQSSDRTPSSDEWDHYTYGGSCWKACGDDSRHNTYITEVTTGNTTYKLADFLQLDWGFQLYFPNTGDFYGTGAKATSSTSAERGWGYVNDMDTAEWIQSKWVKFPFAVIYNDTTYLANERIYLEVPKTLFDFYLPLHDSEVSQARVEYGNVAINTQTGTNQDCSPNATKNIASTSYRGHKYSHRHSSDKYQYIDIIGRIGNLTLEDTGDFRFANFFKQTTAGWIVDNIVKKVDTTKQNNLVLDATDVRMVPVTSTGVMANTHGMRPERGIAGKLYKFPLTPISNNIGALNKQPVRVGYDSYLDLTTLGNYYGVEGSQKVQIQPYYYRLDLVSGAWEPVDVYMDNNGTKVLINCFGDATKGSNAAGAQVNMDWVAESARRNYNGKEVTMSNQVTATYPWTYLPSGSSWVYGNYNVLNLTQRNRTFVGSEYTYGWHKDPSNRLAEVAAGLQGARWHFNVGLPSSATFVRHGQSPTQANIDACKGNAVIVCALEVFAKGEVWTLKYTGENINVPFKVTGAYPDKTYDPNSPGGPGKDKPIVIIYSIDKSSKEDLGTTGNQ